MIRRVCDSCGTPLPGKRKHGFVVDRRLVCGRRKVQKTIVDSGGTLVLKEVDTPKECWA